MIRQKIPAETRTIETVDELKLKDDFRFINFPIRKNNNGI